jgi:hypothetical protein
MTDVTETEEITGSIFDDEIDVDEIPDNPNHLPEDVYTCRISNAVLKPTAKKDKIGLTISYQISEGDYASSFPFTEWLWCPRRQRDEAGELIPFTVEETRANSKLKKRYTAFGIGADEFKTTGPKDLIGLYVKVRTKNVTQDDNERIKVVQVLPVGDDEPGSDEGMDVFSPKDDI